MAEPARGCVADTLRISDVQKLATVLVAAATLVAVAAAMTLTSTGLVFAQPGVASR